MKNLYRILGLLCVALGTAGVFLPVLPTTPFLLAAMFLFTRSSEKLRQRLLNNKLLGPYIKCYASEGGLTMSWKVKTRTLVMMWSVMLLSAYLVDILWVRLLLLAVAIGVTVHIVLIKNPEV